MTTILTTKDRVYSDTQMGNGSMVANEKVLKFIPMTEGRIAYCCGTVPNIMAAICLLEDPGRHKDRLKESITEVTTLRILHSDGFLEAQKFTKNDKAPSMSPLLWHGYSTHKAVGSGTPFVNEFYRMGGIDPLKAMAHAARFDTATGSNFVSIPRQWNKNVGCLLTIHGEGRKKDKTLLLEHPEDKNWALNVLMGVSESQVSVLSRKL